MASTNRLKDAAPSRGSRRSLAGGTITPVFPLLLLETMRDVDRPDEVLEDEDLSSSLPRRLGLSEVVSVQIRRFKEEVRLNRGQSVAQIEDLIRLVVRRPDAERIFEEAGRRIARRGWGQRSRALRRTLRFMPRPLALIAAHRAARRMFRQLTGESRFTVSRWPLELKISHSLSARADTGGAACAFYAGAFGELLEHYTGRRYRVQHPRCETRGAAQCEWEVEVAG